jgi:DNA helicase-2/ATP-dependent DNA helicase PcrA
MTERGDEIRLTPEQEAVVRTERGPLLVLAPVGSGKTLVMARRLAAAIHGGMPAAGCLCLTFTNRAARELRSRVAALGEAAREVAVFTFHGFCAHLLRQESGAAGLPAVFSIQDELDSLDLLERCHPRRLELGADTAVEARALYHDWGRRLSALPLAACTLGAIAAEALQGLDGERRAWLGAYLGRLKAMASLDYPLLVHQARALLAEEGETRRRWRERFQWIQVDEVQDTHLSEWSLLEILVAEHGNLAFFGDLDQTIYGWRGSRPQRLLEEFRRVCGDPQVLQLSTNHRGTHRILELAGRVAAGLPERHTILRPAPGLPEGQAVRWLLADDPAEAARRIAQDLKARAADGSACAVLARANGVCRQVAAELEKAGLTPLLEEDLRLSRRSEVRALLAPLRLAVNGEDAAALRHWLAWGGPEPGLRGLLERIQPHLADCHLALTDLVAGETLRRGDPFAPLLEAWEGSHHVVLDVETTGLDPEQDEVVEIACQRWSRDLELDRLHLLLRPTRPLGASASVHGLDGETLRREGRDPATAFAELADFVGDSLVVGHNIAFDLAMLAGQARRLGLRPPAWPAADTLLLARRVLRSGSMRLGDLATRLELPRRPTHRAMDDVGATALLLARLVPALLENREDRRDLVAAATPTFGSWAARMDKLRILADTLRPAELLDFVLGQDWFRRGLPGGEASRALVRLVRWVRRLDEGELARRSPREALRAVLEQAALARPVDLLEEGAVPVLTIHAAKGMEFDKVWLAGLCQGILPDFRNQQGEGLAEERRVCYVGITRARRELCCVAWRLDGRGRPAGWSEFVKGEAVHG